MTINSKEKGARAELAIRDILRAATGLPWERTPQSGALNAVHGLKGDLYIPNERNYYCIEVKHYADDHLTSKVLTDKTPQLYVWWQQTLREAEETHKQPCLIFKHDRSKPFVMAGCEGYDHMSRPIPHRALYLNEYAVWILKLDDWLSNTKPRFTY